MSRVNYFFRDGEYVAKSVTDTADVESLEICFDEEIDSTIVIGTMALAVKDGRCTVSMKKLRDGTYDPYVLKEKRKFSVDGFSKTGTTVKLLPTPEERIRILMRKEMEIQKRISELDQKIRALSDKIAHTTIF